MSVYKCPVCEGRGQVPAGFYFQNTPATVVNTCPETCRSCGGKGVIFDTDCFDGVNQYNQLPDDYSITLPDDYNYESIQAIECCSNCAYTDGMVYTSMPPKYKCAITHEWHESSYVCDNWCMQESQLLIPVMNASGNISDYISLTSINGTEDNIVESVNGTNTTERTSDG